MTLVPSVSITKQDGQTGVVGPSAVGILAIIAAAAAGAFNTPAQYTSDRAVCTDYGAGPLTEECSYTLGASGQPVIPIRGTTTTAATYGAITFTGTGTSVVTAGTTHPADNYAVTVTIVAGGTIGVTGITYTYSLDGVNTSAVQSLGTANTLTIPDLLSGASPGVSFALAAGTLVAGDTWTCATTAAQMSNTDLSASLEALRVSTQPWEGALIDAPISAGTVALVDQWLAALESVGKFRFAVMNTPMKGTTSETAYTTAMTTLVAGQTKSIRMVLAADGGDVTSTLTGLTLPRVAALGIAADAMAIPIGQNPAWVDAGPIPGFGICDAKGNPKYHNEEPYPNLSALQLATLRTVGADTGATYICNALVFSTVGSDYVLLPHIRTMNRACEVAFAILQKQLGRGVGKKPKDKNTGAVYIAESDAASIEGLVNGALQLPMKGQVQAFKFSLSRTDDLSSNAGAVLTGTMQIEALAYIAGFKVIASFAKDISVAA